MAAKKKKYPQEWLREKEVNAIFKTFSRRTPSGIRNRALVAILYRTAVRISEALALYEKDLDGEEEQITVLFGKGSKSRVVGNFGSGAQDIVQRWIDTRRKLKLTGRHPLFCTISSGKHVGPWEGSVNLKPGKPLSDRYVRDMLKRQAAEAKIVRRVTPHTWRHTWAVEAHNRGDAWGTIQDQLGHSKIETTAHYLRSLVPGAGIKKLKGDDWVDDSR